MQSLLKWFCIHLITLVRVFVPCSCDPVGKVQQLCKIKIMLQIDIKITYLGSHAFCFLRLDKIVY